LAKLRVFRQNFTYLAKVFPQFFSVALPTSGIYRNCLLYNDLGSFILLKTADEFKRVAWLNHIPLHLLEKNSGGEEKKQLEILFDQLTIAGLISSDHLKSLTFQDGFHHHWQNALNG
jgi:hypothetical protein